jgi:hypothetical protein
MTITTAVATIDGLRRPSSCVRVLAAVLLAAVVVPLHACRKAPEPFAIRLVYDAQNPSQGHIQATGVDRDVVRTTRNWAPTSPEWHRAFVVHVVTPEGGIGFGPPMAGKYTLEGDGVRFTPLFPFDPGRTYEVRYVPGLRPAAEANGDRHAPVEERFTVPAGPPTAAVSVTHIYPSGDVVPENQLRLYIHFSGPMGRRGGLEHITLLDEKGRVVEDPFLPLDAEFFNDDRTRYTVFFDPGRQKRGILPNRQMGPSLVDGKRYTLVVDRAWTDGHSQPLRETFKHEFRVGPPALQALDPKQWKIQAPAQGTREPLVVTFPVALDHGLLLRALGVRRDGQPVVGVVRVENRETRWVLTPREPWSAGRYELLALSFLEDVAGNRIGRPFEVDNFERVDKSAEPEAFTVPFTLGEPGR